LPYLVFVLFCIRLLPTIFFTLFGIQYWIYFKTFLYLSYFHVSLLFLILGYLIYVCHLLNYSLCELSFKSIHHDYDRFKLDLFDFKARRAQPRRRLFVVAIYKMISNNQLKSFVFVNILFDYLVLLFYFFFEYYIYAIYSFRSINII
jgi:hypothetical protein